MSSPLDFLKPGTEYASQELAAERLATCKACPDLISKVNVCKHCGCFMAAKTKLAAAECPVGKW
jgi:hypothetical protein